MKRKVQPPSCTTAWRVDEYKATMAKKHTKGLVLDLGCYVRYYQPFCKGIYVGLDQRIWDQRRPPDLIADAEKLPLRAHCADTIVAFDIVEHLRNDELFLQECSRVLKHGGIILITCPSYRSKDLWSDFTHRRAYNFVTLGLKLTKHGIFPLVSDTIPEKYVQVKRVTSMLPASMGTLLARLMVFVYQLVIADFVSIVGFKFV